MANNTVTLTLTDEKHGEMEVILRDVVGPVNKWTSKDEGGRLGIDAGSWVLGLNYPPPSVELRDQENKNTVAVLQGFSFNTVKPGELNSMGDGTKLWSKGSFISDDAGLHWVVTKVS
jgi:hypothetical protein